MREIWVHSLGGQEPLERVMATHSSNLAGGSHGQRSLEGYGLLGRVNYKSALREHWTTKHCPDDWTTTGNLPSASTEIEPQAAIAVDRQQSLREFWWSEALCAPGNVVGQVSMFLGTGFMISILATPHI